MISRELPLVRSSFLFGAVYKGKQEIVVIYQRYRNCVILPGDAYVYIPFYFMYMNLTSRSPSYQSPTLFLSLFRRSILLNYAPNSDLYVDIPTLQYLVASLVALDFLGVEIFRNFSRIVLCLLDSYIAREGKYPLV